MISVEAVSCCYIEVEKAAREGVAMLLCKRLEDENLGLLVIVVSKFCGRIFVAFVDKSLVSIFRN